jgi:hypothetical protein
MDTAIVKRRHDDTGGPDEHDYDDRDRSAKCAKTAVKLVAQTCYFYRLPRELRDNIYHHLWEATPFVERHYAAVKIKAPSHNRIHNMNVDSTCKVIYDDRDYRTQHSRVWKPLPKWLLVDKTFLEEGSKMLRIHGKWLLYNYNIRSKRDLEMVGILSPAGAEYLQVPFVQVFPRPSSTICGSYQVLKSLQGQNNLKRLEMDMVYHVLTTEKSVCIGSNDLLTLESLITGFPHLQKLVLCLARTFSAWAIIEKQLQQLHLVRAEVDIPDVVKRILGDDMVQSTKIAPGDLRGAHQCRVITFQRR